MYLYMNAPLKLLKVYISNFKYCKSTFVCREQTPSQTKRKRAKLTVNQSVHVHRRNADAVLVDAVRADAALAATNACMIVAAAVVVSTPAADAAAASTIAVVE